MLNDLLQKLKTHISLMKAIQLSYILIIIGGVLFIVIIANNIYKNYLKTINYTNDIVTPSPSSESADFKNFEVIIKKINNKTASKKNQKINNVFD